MDDHKGCDADASLSISLGSLDNVTEVVETEPSHANADDFLNLNGSFDKYELVQLAGVSDSRLRRGTIHSIELHNFKSYFGTVVIDKLASFNAIIGPNGAGKSNLMDAISFVLCIRTATLRGTNLKDLINKNPDASDPVEARFAYVALTLKGDTGLSLFKRVISSKGHITYIYNNNVITFKGYTEALQEYKINTLGSTGLIFQGSVNDIITRSPSELTKLFENISGSSLYEKPYNYIKEKLELVRAEYKNMAAKKKQLATELKQLRSMASTNKKYHQHLGDYKQAQLNSYACQLTILSYKFRDSSAKYKSLQTEYRDLLDKYEASNRSKNQLEGRMASLYYDQGRVNRQIQQKTQALNNMRSSMLDFFSKKAALENQLENLQGVLKSTKDDLANLESQRDEIGGSRRVLSEEIDKLSTDIAALEGNMVALSEEQMQEFNRYLKEFKNATSSINVNRNLIKTSINQQKTESKMVEGKLKGLKGQLEKVEENVARHNQLMESMETKVREHRESVEVLHMRLNKLRNDLSELQEQKQELESKRSSHDDRMKSLTMLKHEYGYMFKRSLSNNEMCKAVPGVYGEVLSLFEISNASYFRPVMTALGNRAHTVVTRDYETLAECIKYLKDHKADRRDFLPLDRVSSDKSATRRSIGHALKRIPKLNYVFVIDSIEFDEKYRALFEYMLGDTVIVPTLDDAEKVVTAKSRPKGDSPLSFNVVTHSGQLITRGRTIVIGSTMAAKNSEIELEIAQFNKYATLLAEVEKELRALSTREKEMSDELDSGATKLEKHRRVIQMTGMKLDFLRNQRDSLKMQQEELASQVAKLSSQKKALDKSISTLNSDLSREDVRLDLLRRNKFAPLDLKFGVEDVYHIVSTRDERAESLGAALNEKNNTLARYDNDLKELEEKIALVRRRVAELETSIDGSRAEMESVKESNVNTCDQLEALQHEIADLKKELDECMARIAECNSEIGKLGPTYSQGPEGRLSVMDQISALRSEMRQFYSEAVALAETCKVKNIPLEVVVPTQTDGSAGGRSVDSDGGSTVVADGSGAPRPGELRFFENSEFSEFDDSALEFPRLANSEKFGFSKNLATLESHQESLQDQLKMLEKSLASLRSFTNVEDRLGAASGEAKIVDREADTLRSQLLKLEADFENIKRERSGLFLHCFHAVKESVGPIYSRLSSVGECEGQAFLSLDDVSARDLTTAELEPFNCNIRYNTMPPMKKYLDLNLQSGGEKALSSIALLLALHNYRRAPFVVMDEIDANIDAVKLRNLTAFLMESTFQVIIISLKEKLFSSAQRLIGVYRAHPTCASRCLVLNLEEYEQEVE